MTVDNNDNSTGVHVSIFARSDEIGQVERRKALPGKVNGRAALPDLPHKNGVGRDIVQANCLYRFRVL
jgi:hypothetical protein